jgi:hypothetical protein
MLKPKTHFEQVPLAVVRKIVEEQMRSAGATDSTDFAKGGICEKQSSKRPN